MNESKDDHMPQVNHCTFCSNKIQ